MNCPIHRVRQLGENFYCTDCQGRWSRDVVERFWEEYAELRHHYDLTIEEAEQAFQEAVKKLLKSLKEKGA